MFNGKAAQLDSLAFRINYVNIGDAQRFHPAIQIIRLTRAVMKISTYMAILPDMRGSLGSFMIKKTSDDN